jgi:hypothetical protein
LEVGAMTASSSVDCGDGLSTAPNEVPVGPEAHRSTNPQLVVERWPEGRPFALFLSHDVDQIHDREVWRLLGDANHIRRVMFKGESGEVRLAARRIGRALLNPKNPLRDYQAVLEIEARHSFRSTFFVLHDRYWARNGARFRLADPAIRKIVGLVRNADCEIAVHGGYYRFNDAAAYEESRQAVAELSGSEVVGIRNHHLRFSGLETWRAQALAGCTYDATYGAKEVLGPRDGVCVPFWAVPPGSEGGGGLVELPLTVMDTTLFRYCGHAGEEALEAAWAAITPVVEAGGLVTLLWHANFFNEPEYWDWQWVYSELLDRLAGLGPWCATGAEIASWFRQREASGGQPLPVRL